MSAIRKLTTMLGAGMLAMPLPAAANDDLVRGLIGLGTAIIVNEAQKSQPAPVRRSQPARTSAPRAVAQTRRDEVEQRESRIEIQRRLNALGFNTGQPDGVFGPRTRSAIAAYQASLGRNPDGRISREEIDLLYAQTGGVAGPAPVAAGSFPQLGMPGAPAGTSPFPQLGAAPGSSSSPATAFPTLGTASPPATASAGSFPSLGTPTGSSSAGAAFPTLGNAPSAESAPGFPQLASEAAAAEETGFPAVANAPQPNAAFPGLGPAPASPDTSMPALGFAEPPAAAAFPPVAAIPVLDPSGPLQETTLEAEVALLPYGTVDKQPRISGVALGDDAKTRNEALKDAGYKDCETTEGLVTCLRKSDTLADTLSIWVDADGRTWAMHRAIEFVEAAPRDLIEAQFSQTYPELMAAPGHAQSSRPNCNAAGLGSRELVIMYKGFSASMANPDGLASDVLSQFGAFCPLVYRIEMVPNLDGVGRVELAFSDFSGVIALAVKAQKAKEEAETKRRETISSDLKL